MKKLSMASKIFLILLLPFIGLLYFSTVQVVHLFETLQDEKRAGIETELVVNVSALIHELQKERGMSAGFISSKGNKFKQDLPPQRLISSQKAETLQNYIKSHSAELTRLREALNDTGSDLEKIAQTREKIDQLLINNKESFTYFSTLIGRYVNIISEISKVSMQAELTKDALAYFALLNLKESSGQERAVVNQALTSGYFTNESFQLFNSLAYAQINFFYVFDHIAQLEARAMAQTIMNKPIFAEVERLREKILSEPKEGPFSVTPETWFKSTTEKINLLKEIEDSISASILLKSAAKITSAQISLGVSLTLLLILVLSSAIFGLKLALSITIQLGCEPEDVAFIAKKISAGVLDIDLKRNGKREPSGAYADIRKMIEGLNDKAAQAEAIASGDLTKEIIVLSEGDRLGKSFQTMSSVLRDVITRSNLAANQVSAGSGQVSSASQSLSQGASEQAAAVEEITSSVTEISSKIKLNADSALNASSAAQTAQSAAEQGNGQIEVTLRAMNDINSASVNISKIIKVIDEIAFQTNILALNAAVEAARAGRHGKGFSVVAEEVRNLASRSAKAAQETTGLIESSSQKVVSGLKEARKTAESFKDIVQGSLQVASIVKQIADASKEQAAAIGQIALGINQINKVTQTTTASAEETAAAAEELAGQSQELKRSLSYFKISHDRESDHFSKNPVKFLKAS